VFSQTAEYALRAVVFLAERPPGTRWAAQKIADGTQIPSGYLSKIMQSLARHQVVSSQRGPSGGFSLGRPPRQISLYEILKAVDPIQRIHKCPLNLPEHATSLCALHRSLDDALALVEQKFRESSVEDLLVGTTFPDEGGNEDGTSPGGGPPGV